jgi:hypothetical protein
LPAQQDANLPSITTAETDRMPSVVARPKVPSVCHFADDDFERRTGVSHHYVNYLAQIGETFFFPTIGVAVSTYLESHKVDWVDWENRP